MKSSYAATLALIVVGLSGSLTGAAHAMPYLSAPAIHRMLHLPSDPSATQEKMAEEREPFVILIGARQHLFDGKFLCHLSDVSPMLSRLM